MNQYQGTGVNWGSYAVLGPKAPSHVERRIAGAGCDGAKHPTSTSFMTVRHVPPVADRPMARRLPEACAIKAVMHALREVADRVRAAARSGRAIGGGRSVVPPERRPMAARSRLSRPTRPVHHRA